MLQRRCPSPQRPLLALLAVALLVLSACGGDGRNGGGQAKDPTKPDPEFVRYSADDVVAHFKRLTGVELDRSTGTQTLDLLDLPNGADSDKARTRYGGFIVSVAKNESALKAILNRTSAAKRKVYANVVVEATSSSDDANGFRRVSTIFDGLGKPANAVKLPPEETPCQQAGIDPEGKGTKEGTCKLEQQTLTVVNANSTLKVPGKEISNLKSKTGSVITSRRFGLTRRFRAQGGFVIVTFRLENTGNEPLSSLRPNLVVEGKRYSPDASKQYYVQSNDPFPIQPDAHETVVALFDIPRPAAAKARSVGALEIVADEESTTIDYAEGIGRVRLGKGSGGGGGEEAPAAPGASRS